MNNYFNLNGGPYGVILADPPWTFQTRSERGKGKSAERHYSCMSIDNIMNMPVREIAAENCALFLWTTDPLLPMSLKIMESWGFTYKTVAFTWVKTNRRSSGFFMGTGYWTRANPEMCLLGTRGNPRRKSRSVRQLVVSPRREHSRKPDEIYDMIEQLVDGPYCELFSRTSMPNWDVWGHETGKFEVDRVLEA